MYKVVVVDDEYIIRQGIVSLVDWKELGCEVIHESDNGDEAWEYLQNNQVDILICDIRMPGKNGLEVAEHIQSRKIPVQIILLTAYSDFEYARKALRYGVKDYIVKTNYIESLPETIKKVIAEIEDGRKKALELDQVVKKLDNSMLLLQEKLIIDILRGTITDMQEVSRQAQWCGFPTAQFYLANFIFSEEEMLKVTESRKEKILKAVRNFISLSLSEYEARTVVIKNTDFVTMIFSDNKEGAKEKIFEQKVFRDLTLLGKAVYDTLGVKVNICYGKKENSLENLRQIYMNVYSTNMRMCFLGKREIVSEEVEKGDGSELLDQMTKEVIEDIEHGLYMEAARMTECCRQEILTERYSMRTIKSRAIDIYFACRRMIEKNGGVISADSKKALPEYQEISSCRSLDRLTAILTEGIQAAADMLNRETQENYSALVCSCIDYICGHYYEKINISLIADKLHVNKSYLGTVFKKETGMSIVETITKYRMDKAMELMQKTSYKLFEISEKVGFDDPAYFTNVFTKYMGISPSAYRSSRQN